MEGWKIQIANSILTPTESSKYEKENEQAHIRN